MTDDTLSERIIKICCEGSETTQFDTVPEMLVALLYDDRRNLKLKLDEAFDLLSAVMNDVQGPEFGTTGINFKAIEDFLESCTPTPLFDAP